MPGLRSASAKEDGASAGGGAAALGRGVRSRGAKAMIGTELPNDGKAAAVSKTAAAKRPPSSARRKQGGTAPASKRTKRGGRDTVAASLASMTEEKGTQSPFEPKNMAGAFEKSTKVSPSDSKDGDEDDESGLEVQNRQLRDDNARKDEVIKNLRHAASQDEQQRKAVGRIRWERRSMAHLSRDNRTALHLFVKLHILPKLKFYHKNWHVFSLRPKTLCAMVLLPYFDKRTGQMSSRARLTPPEGKDVERFWFEDVVPALAYKLSQLKNTFLQKMKDSYKREIVSFVRPCIATSG